MVQEQGLQLTSEANALALLDEGYRLLAEANTVPKATKVVQWTELMKDAARRANMTLETQNRFAELNIEAEANVGGMLADVPHEQGRRQPGNTPLQSLGVERMQSSRWQKVAAVPKPSRREYVREVAEKLEQATSTGLVRWWKVAVRHKLNGVSNDVKPEPKQGAFWK